MNVDKQHTVTILIMGKEYKIACTEDEELALKQAAKHLDNQMREIRETGKVIGLERIAVMAALNLSHELLQQKAESSISSTGSHEQVGHLNLKLDGALQRLKQLEI